MKKTQLINIYKEGVDYAIKIPAGTTGRDVELGLANAIKLIADHQREVDPTFKTETLVEAIKSWIKCLE